MSERCRGLLNWEHLFMHKKQHNAKMETMERMFEVKKEIERERRVLEHLI